MKKLFFLIIAVTVMALVVGCGSSPKSTPAASTSTAAPSSPNNPNLPAWLNERSPENSIYGVGSAKLTNQSLAWQTATTRAQRDAADQLGVLIQGMLTDYANESGLAENPRSMIAIENITRGITNMTIVGDIDKRDQTPDGTYWIRIEVPRDAAARQMANIIQNETADYAEFRAAQAIEKLNFELSKATMTTTGRSE